MMKNGNWSFVLSMVFILVVILALILNKYYKAYQYTLNTSKIYSKLSSNISKKVQMLIEEKKNATLTISLALAQDQRLNQAILDNRNIQTLLNTFSLKLREETDFKNVWFQLVNKEGKVVSRSWSDERGDNLLEIRTFKDIQKVHTSIDVDKYDLSFKALVPLFDKNNHFIGFLETITHFNSIAKKISKEGFKPIIIVDKAYTKQLKYPFTQSFIEGHYIANKNVDQSIIEHIKKHQSLHSFLNYKSIYSIDDHNTLLVHHTLFDNTEQSMAYILMFRSLNSIDTSTLKNRSLLINILSFLGLLTLSFLLLLLYIKEKSSSLQEHHSQKYMVFFSLLFVLAVLLLYTILNLNYTREKKEFFKNHQRMIHKDFNVIQGKYQSVANTMFETVINNTSVKKIMKQAYHDVEQKDLARKTLYALLVEKYRLLQTYDLRQLHFHLKNNESFLRFHRPDKYGDNLTGIRATVEWVNENHTPVEGFEEGRIYNGFRYVFPLTLISNNHKEHLGSVETSFSAHAIAREFAHSHNAKTGFFVAKSVVNEKVFKNEQSNYAQSPLAGFYYEGIIKKQLEYEFKHIEIEKLDEQNIKIANKRILQGEIFTLSSIDQKTFFTFLPLKNPISKKIVASIVLQVDNETLLRFKYNHIIIFAIGIILILLATMFIYREYLSKIRLQNLSLKTKRILDTQKSIIVITNGEEILDINQAFLDFLGYPSLEVFKKEYRCICDLFIRHDNYYHLGKVPDGRNWVKHLDTISNKDKVVLIKDKGGHECSLAISYNAYKDNYFVVTFNDISGTIQEQIMLQEKIILDQLTHTYNREFFASNAKKIIHNTYSQNKKLAIIFFDIDHFKKINDTYGHDIGDYVLQELVAQVKASVRESDYLIRWGGEEFILLIATQSIDGAKKVAQNLRLIIEDYPFEHIKKLTCSFGVTLLLSKNEEIQSAIKRADQALYFSKKSGRNCVTLHS